MELIHPQMTQMTQIFFGRGVCCKGNQPRSGKNAKSAKYTAS